MGSWNLKVDIIVAHPGKHHVLHLVAGCIKSGASVSFITPFYRSGLGKILSKLPVGVGAKSNGYHHSQIPAHAIFSPLTWQLKKIWSLFRKNQRYAAEFDEYVASKIETGEFKAKVLVTLQDYMPKTVYSAKRKNIIIWSDQISNQSDETSARIKRHESSLGLSNSWIHSEKINTEIIHASRLITAPSNYCFEGIAERIGKSTKIELIPYGASPKRFSLPKTEGNNEIVVLARAQSIRKGGHLLHKALEDCGNELLELASPKKVRFIILGEMDKTLKNAMSDVKMPLGLSIEHGNIPHTETPKTYQKSSLFVMPSLSESLSLACLEAMHAGLPLIVTKYCGLDGFSHGKMGYLIDDSATSLAKALVKAFENMANWDEWGEEAQSFAKDYTWEVYEERIANIARELLCKV